MIAGRTPEQLLPQEARAYQESTKFEPVSNGNDLLIKRIESFLAQPDFFPEEKRLYGFQVDGIRFLATKQVALLGDEMGLGKTIQAIGALKILGRLDVLKKTLVLCPRPLVSQWQYEFRQWAPELFVQKVRGPKVDREKLWGSGASVLITSYETWRIDLNRLPSLTRHFDLVILDEVQKVKHPTAAITQAVRKLRSPYRWGLSGTPLENRVDDVVSIFDYLVPDLFRPIEPPYKPATVKRLMKPYFLRRRASNVQRDLPPKIVKSVWLDLTEQQHKAYELVEGESRKRLGQNGATRMHIFAEINKLKQICNVEEISGESCKVDYVIEELEDIIANDQKALIFSQFPRKTLSRIEFDLSSFYPAIYHGGLTDRKGDRLLSDFQNKQKPKVLLASVKSAGVGLNLARANHVIHFDHWWNPAVEYQAEGRAHRIGQPKTVFVHSLFTNDTIEEKINALLDDKRALFNTVIDDLSEEQIKGALSNEELFGLFGLEAPQTGKTKRKHKSGYRPSATYEKLKRLESEIDQAESVEEVQSIAQNCHIAPKAFCFLLGEIMTLEQMSGKNF